MKIQPKSSAPGVRFFWVAALVCLLALLAVNGCSNTTDSGPGSSAAGSAEAGSASSEAGASAAGAPDTSTDVGLTDLAPSVGALIPVFVPTKTSYTLRVPNGTTSVALTPTAGVGASIQIDGAAVASGQASDALALATDGSGLDITVAVSPDGASAPVSYKVHVSVQPLPKGLVIHSVGDSTMANYDPAVTPNQRGWMQMFPELVTGDDVTVANAAINGTSSKSFYLTGAWDMVKATLVPGDYVLIQFAHNDEKDGGIEGATGIGTAAFGAYHDYLTKYVNETRALGAIPILVTPVVRLSWNGATLTPTACHDLTGNGIAVGDANYPEAMRDVATMLDVPLLDLTLASKALVEEYGPTDAKAELYIAADDTHLQVMGATVYAVLAAQGLVALDLFTGHLNPVLGLRVSSPSLDFGTRYLGTTLDSSFSVLGASLVPEAGNVTFTAPAGFLVGTDVDHLAATLELPYVRGALPPVTVYVRFQPLVAQTYAEPLTSSTGATAQTSVVLSAAALDMPTGAVEASAVYALDAATSGLGCTATGGVTCADELLSGLYVKDYSPLTTLLPQPTPLPTQRLSIVSTPTADSWPLETDTNAARYVEFAITAAAGKTMSVDTVSLYAGASGGPTMAYRVQCSTADDFSAPTDLLDATDNATNTLTFHAFSPLTSVAPGKTFHVRLYPYSKALATKKYLSLASVTVHGVAW